MGKSLYQISDELQLLLYEIEENGGEITEEQEKELEISQEELNNKVENYCNAITLLKSEEECAKNEKKRLNDMQTVKKNLIERLKSTLLKTVNKFGYDGKSGNKILEVTNHKLFTKNGEVVVLNEERFNTMAKRVKSYIIELYQNGILQTGENIDIEGMLGAINAIAKSEEGDDFIPYTIQDLSMIKFNFEYAIEFTQLMKGNANDVAKLILSPIAILNFTPSDSLKDYLKLQKNIESVDISFAHLEDKPSLTIK